MKIIKKIKYFCKKIYILLKNDRISPTLGTIYEFEVPFYMYVGDIRMGLSTKRNVSYGSGNKNPHFNIERYKNKFIRLSIFKGTWLVQSVYDGGYAGVYFVTVLRQDLPKKYKERIPYLILETA